MTTTLFPSTSPASTWEHLDDHPWDLAPWEFRLAETEHLLDELETDNQQPTDTLDYPLPVDFKLSVIVPVFNEEATTATVVQRLLQLPFRTEIVIVEDGSTDRTRDVLTRLAHFCDLKIIYHARNQGKGAAIRTALRYVTGDVVVIQDADLEYEPQDIAQVIRPIVTGEADVAYGSRFMSEAKYDRDSWLHRLGNQALTCASNLLTGLRLTDMETGCKAFSRNIIQRIEVQQNRFGFEPEITAKLAKRKYRFVECPIQFRTPNWAASNKVGWQEGLSALWCIFRYRFSD
ncbi:glycosyltransferase family 2 protein [Bremerella cremea]|uniref:glycosyltransferase family 2 protein n=1 Tax=Bremerella cremea TaxID=1031537 RepID=UPI0031E7AC8E